MKELKEIVANHPFFRSMKPEYMDTLVEGATTANFKSGEILFREGEPANKFYLIQSGKVALEIHEKAGPTARVETLGGGDVLGWSWLYPPFVWHFQARTLEPTQTVALSGAHLLMKAERDHEFGYELMKRLTQVVIHRLQVTRRNLLQLQVDSALEG